MGSGARAPRGLAGWAAALALTGALLATSTARASMFDIYGFGARGVGMAGALVALPTRNEAVYYNPANLLAIKVSHLALGVDLIVPTLSVDRVAGEGPLEAHIPPTSLTIDLGLATPIGGVFADRVAVGFALFHPLLSGTRIESLDPRVPYFYRYDALPQKIILAGAAAAEPLPWLRVGVGAQVLAELDGAVRGALSLEEGRFSSERTDIDLFATVAPTAGLALGPFHGVRAGLAFRGALELHYSLLIDVLLEEVGVLAVNVDGTSLYTPDQLAAGVSWEGTLGGGWSLSVEAGLTWERWSAAPAAGADFQLHIDDSVLRAQERADGRPVQDLILSERDPVPLGAEDIVIPRLGVEARFGEAWRVRMGYLYRVTPLPIPAYEANTLDSSAHVVSLGVGYAFADPTEVHEAPLIIDLALQLTALRTRTVPKLDGYEPGGTYRFGGVISHVALELHHDF